MYRCTRCQGSKRIAPMGGIYVECPNCHGIGYVKQQMKPELFDAKPSKEEKELADSIDYPAGWSETKKKPRSKKQFIPYQPVEKV